MPKFGVLYQRLGATLSYALPCVIRPTGVECSVRELRVGICLVMAIGCTGDPADPKYVLAEDRGHLCAASPGAMAAFSECPMTFAADTQVELHVDFELCLSGSCDTPGPSSCSAQRNGSVIRVTAVGKYTSETVGACTDDCKFLRTRCATEALPAGQYTIEYAGKSLPLEIPSTTTAHCMPHHTIAPCSN
jgi:hypothetical protein